MAVVREKYWSGQSLTGRTGDYGLDVVDGDKVIFFGGFCGHDACFYNTITELNTTTMSWKLISPESDAEEAPLGRAHCAMISFKDDAENNLLCIVGGEDAWPPSAKSIDYSKKARLASKKMMFTASV